MNRFELLETKINKGIIIDNKSNQLILGWSPNNVKRLIVGFEYAIIQYHRTGGKYTKLSEIVDLRRASQKDLELLQQDPSKYKPILEVLTAGRICSSVEEIIIYVDRDYPQPMLNLDMDLRGLSKGNTTLENRFVRLRHISVVQAPIKELSILAEHSKVAPNLLLDYLEKENVPTNTLVSQHEDDWWRGISLRPKYYQMDDSMLPDHFDKIKEKVGQSQKAEKLDQLTSEKDLETIKKYNPALTLVIGSILESRHEAHTVFQSSPILSKAEWANVLESKALVKGIRKELLNHEELIQDARRIDFERIIKRTQEANLQGVEELANFETLIFEEILSNEEQYKRDSNKHDLRQSLQTLQKVAGIIFNTQVNIVYLAFAKYLTRNTPKYAEFFCSQLSQPLHVIYTRSNMGYCNRYLEDGWAKQAMDNIQAKEILVEGFTFPLKKQQVKQILKALTSR